MRSTTLRMVAAAISSALVLGAGATAASAAPATFSSTGAISTALVGSLVFKVGTTPNPATTITCTHSSGLSPTGTVTNTVGVPAQGKVTSFALTGLSCVSGTGQSAGVFAADNNSTNFPMLANKTGSDYSLSGNGDWHLSLYAGSSWWDSIPVFSAGYTAGWVNYPAAPSSKLVFTNAPIGHVASSPGAPMIGQPITLTATFFVRTQGGSNITLI